jgi:ABC-type transport system involved in multi-copper enzyme maturation permease subunit
MRTLLALIRDTLIALRRRRLFWLHFWLNAAVVLMFAGVQCHGQGWSIFFGMKELPSTWLRADTPWESTLHCWTLTCIMLWWVAGGGLFFALFATAAILPETLEPGSAALILPRARRRGAVLAGRFLGSLLYMLLHTVFVTGGLWLVQGWQQDWRWEAWHHGIWLAVPLAALLFAPLQAVAMLMGVLTRSATAALLVAILFAGSVWALQSAAAAPDKMAAAPAATEEPNASGFGAALTGEAAQQASSVLPQSRDALLWLERRACPRPLRTYRDLFRRLHAGHSGLGAAAADALAAANSPALQKEVDRTHLFPVVVSSAGFTLVTMAAAAWLLRRRDL